MMKLNGRLQPLNSIPARQQYTPGIDFDTRYEVQTRQINASQVALGTLVKTLMGATGTASFALTDVLTATSQVFFLTPFENKKMLGVPYIAFYQGTIPNVNTQIWPVCGGSVTEGRYAVQGWFDHRSWNGTVGYWAGQIRDTDGTSTQIITFAADWAYLDYTVGVTNNA